MPVPRSQRAALTAPSTARGPIAVPFSERTASTAAPTTIGFANSPVALPSATKAGTFGKRTRPISSSWQMSAAASCATRTTSVAVAVPPCPSTTV